MTADGTTAGSVVPVEPPVTPPAEELDDPAWREQWPNNVVHIVPPVLPRISDSPALDGV